MWGGGGDSVVRKIYCIVLGIEMWEAGRLGASAVRKIYCTVLPKSRAMAMEAPTIQLYNL